MGERGVFVDGSQRLNAGIVVCYQCGQEGHTRLRCPNNPSTHINSCSVPRPKFPAGMEPGHLPDITVLLNEQEVSTLIDTGSMQTIVKADLVPMHFWDFTSLVVIRCLHGEEKHYPTANVYVKVQEQTYLLKATLSCDLPYSMVLGQDLPVLMELLTATQVCGMAVSKSLRHSWLFLKMAGRIHLGKLKTIAHIRHNFYWPGIQKEMAQYGKTCPQCQQTLKGPPRAPLEPLLIISVPFEQLGMDIVGPLERTKAGSLNKSWIS